MNAVDSPGAVKGLHKWQRTGGRYQRTFHTPLDKLTTFTQAILAPHVPLTHGAVTIDEVVFTPRFLEWVLAKYSLPFQCQRDRTITASGHEEISELLQACFGDWLNFYFVPTPQAFIVYADHDEYTTIFAATKGAVSRTAESLLSLGFEEIRDYERLV
jgi:hypothetical protein